MATVFFGRFEHSLDTKGRLILPAKFRAHFERGGYLGKHDERCLALWPEEEFARRICANPRNYIAQPMLALSRAPVIVGDHFEPRHVDLRPFVLLGEEPYVLPGGLTRVALQRGSLVVSSSQGGGSKDTWVLAE